MIAFGYEQCHLLDEAEAAARSAMALQRHAEHAPMLTRAAWREVALPAARALLAHARGDFDGAVRGLTATLPRLQERCP